LTKNALPVAFLSDTHLG